jgi:hypothetical protein
VDSFLRDADSILRTAVGVASTGERPTEMVILTGVSGGIQMLAECDWPLHSMRTEKGAASAYRVAVQGGTVVVEGEGYGRKCRLEQSLPFTVPTSVRIRANTSRCPQLLPPASADLATIEIS